MTNTLFSTLARTTFGIIGAVLLVTAASAAKQEDTHLGVQLGRVAALHTFNIPNDNSGGHLFYYDRQVAAPFAAVPDGYAFVVTDIIIELQTFGTLSGEYLVIVNFDDIGRRIFAARFLGESGSQHYALSGGFVIEAGHQPTARNTAFSTDDVEVQLLGYFVKGDGMGVGTSFAP